MKRINFNIDISANPQKIWNSIWNDSHYRKWAAVYFEGSYLSVDQWEVGAIVQFLNPDKTGVYSKIQVYQPCQLVNFKHLGLIKNGKNQPVDDETKKWTGSTEVYQIIEKSDHCTLTLELDVLDKHLEFMSNNTPKALNTIKSIAEQH